LAVLLLVPFFFIGGADHFSPQYIKTLWDFGHVVFFAVLLLLVQSFKPLIHWQQWVWVTLFALVLGGAIETLQHFVGRNASWDDVLHNLFGVWLGLFWGQKPTRRVWLLRFVSVICVLPAAWLVVDSAWADFVMRKQFPVINSFESRAELQQVYTNGQANAVAQTTGAARHGSQALVVDLSTRLYSGVRLIGPYGDWDGYQFLVMDFYNPQSQPLDLVVKISDYLHDAGSNQHRDRFNRSITLMMGWSEVWIALEDIRNAPAGRLMQLDRMTGLEVFASRLPEPRSFYWDNVRLE
jgi:hypothetical protein